MPIDPLAGLHRHRSARRETSILALCSKRSLTTRCMAMRPAGVRRYHQSEASSNFRGGESDFEAARLAPSATECRRICSAIRSFSGISHSRDRGSKLSKAKCHRRKFSSLCSCSPADGFQLTSELRNDFPFTWRANRLPKPCDFLRSLAQKACARPAPTILSASRCLPDRCCEGPAIGPPR